MLVEKAETGSTNDDARDLALGGAPHGTGVLAARQTRGRGRAGRPFAPAPGGLYLSVVLRPALPPNAWGLLPLALGAAAVDALAGHGAPLRLKWPNDLLHPGGGKVGGILVESRWGADPFCVAGIGLNLGAPPADVPGAGGLGWPDEATRRRGVAESLRRAFVSGVDALVRDGPGQTLARIRACCVTLGRRVEWEEGEGTAVDVAEDGALVVDANGRRHRIVAGDVRVGGTG